MDSILIFGGGQLQLSIIRKTKLLGFRTIVIDPDKNAIGKELADIFIGLEGDDFEGTVKVVDKYSVKGIVTAATDKPILMMSRIAKECNLNFPSYQSCESLLDKAKFKCFLNKHHIPHARGFVFNNNSLEPIKDLNYPVIVKPVMNSGSRGVIKCNFPENIEKAIKETKLYCKDGRFIVEEYVFGDEISVEALVYKQNLDIIQLTDKNVTEPPYNVELGHLQPSKYLYLEKEIRVLLQKIIDKSGLDNCALHAELKIEKDKITIIEIGPRLGGDFITSHLVPLSTQVNMEEIMVKISMRDKITYNKTNEASLVSFLNFPEGKIMKKNISAPEIKLLYPFVKEFELSLELGSKVKKITNSFDRYGYFILAGKSVSELIEQKDSINMFLLEYLF